MKRCKLQHIELMQPVHVFFLVCALMLFSCQSNGQNPTDHKTKSMKIDDTNQYVRPDEAKLRKMLTAEQYAITQEAATERPFTNAYDTSSDREFMWISPRDNPCFCLLTNMIQAVGGLPSRGLSAMI